MITPRPPAIAVELEVPFHDVDAGLIVWHGHYFKYLEIARTALFRAHRLDVVDVLELGYRMVVTDTRCRYQSPLQYGDRFRVTARLNDLDPLIHISYLITDSADERRIARAMSTLALIDARGGHHVPISDEIRSRWLTAPSDAAQASAGAAARPPRRIDPALTHRVEPAAAHPDSPRPDDTHPGSPDPGGRDPR